MSRLHCAALVWAICLLVGTALVWAAADEPIAAGLRVEVVITGIPRPIQLAWDAAGHLVVLSHGWRGDAAGELYRFQLKSLPLDASRSPRMVIPFSEGPRKAAFGSLAVDPRSGDLFLGEENGNRIYRLTGERKLVPFAVGLHYLAGGSSLAFDGRGRLVILDFLSVETHLRSETPLPPDLDWLTIGAYHGPLVFRLDPEEDIPLPRRLDLLSPLFPRASTRIAAGEPLTRFVAAAVSPGADLFFLSSLGELFKLTPEAALQPLARLPGGHYYRTSMVVGPDGSVFVSTGLHLREVFRVSAAGVVTSVARELGDPGGVVVDRTGALYVAETARHRIIRISPSP